MSQSVCQGGMSTADDIVARVRSVIGDEAGFVPLHEPEFHGDEWDLVKDCLDSGWVSSVGKYVDQFEAEIARIDRILAERHGLGPFEATKLRREAETLESEAPDTVRFTRAIKDAVPYEERAGVIEALWSVVLADGVRDHEEDALLRLTANLLGVNDRDSALARQRVEARG